MLAGGGRFPVLLARAAKSEGRPVAAVAHLGETDESLAREVDALEWVKIGQLQRTMDFFKSQGVSEAIMAGRITKKNMFSNFEPDERALLLAARLPTLNDDVFLRALSEELETEGIAVKSAADLVPELIAPKGLLSQRPLTPEEAIDVRFGWRIAKALGELDVGQLAVVRDRTVLALEAIDGSDATIRRGGNLARENAVVVKTVKPGQDLRFDLPSVGAETISVMKEVKASVLAIEAGKTLIFDRARMLAAADEAGMAVVALEREDDV